MAGRPAVPVRSTNDDANGSLRRWAGPRRGATLGPEVALRPLVLVALIACTSERPDDTDVDDTDVDDTDVEDTDVDDADTGDSGERPDPAASWFETDVVREIEIVLPQPSIDALNAEPREYVSGTLSIPDEGVGPVEVGVRLKGQYGSFRPLGAKSAFKIDLNRFDADFRLHGLKELTLNNQVQDPSGLHDYAAYALFRGMGIAAPRATWVTVRVNGEDYGTYLSVEGYDDVMLDRWFDTTTHLYEGAYGQDLTPDQVFWIESDEGDEWDRSDLGALTEILAEAPIERAVAETRDRVAWRDVARSMAVEVWTGHWDGYVPNRNNYYLHFDGDGRMRLLPWGVDQTFSARLGPFEGIGLLFWACASDAGCREDYVRALLEVDGVADDLALADDLIAQVERLRPWYDADPLREHGDGSQDATLDETLSFLDTRGDDLAAVTSCWLSDDIDPDGDGYACDQDCDPTDGDVHPGATDACGDGLDQDCSGYPDDAPECPDCQEREINGTTYLFCTTPRTYADGLVECVEQGAQLVTLDDATENEAVWSAAASIREIEWWIGVDDRVDEGVYVGPTGDPVAFTAWNDGEPNDWGGSEDCGHFWSFAPIWNDIGCDATMGTICEASTNAPD